MFSCHPHGADTFRFCLSTQGDSLHCCPGLSAEKPVCVRSGCSSYRARYISGVAGVPLTYAAVCCCGMQTAPGAKRRRESSVREAKGVVSDSESKTEFFPNVFKILSENIKAITALSQALDSLQKVVERPPCIYPWCAGCMDTDGNTHFLDRLLSIDNDTTSVSNRKENARSSTLLTPPRLRVVPLDEKPGSPIRHKY